MSCACTTQMRHALIAPGVDVAGIEDRHLGVRRVQAADMAVGQAVLAADEDFPKGPFARHVGAPYSAAGDADARRAARFLGMRHQAVAEPGAILPGLCLRAARRSWLQGPLPVNTSWNSFQSGSPKVVAALLLVPLQLRIGDGRGPDTSACGTVWSTNRWRSCVVGV